MSCQEDVSCTRLATLAYLFLLFYFSIICLVRDRHWFACLEYISLFGPVHITKMTVLPIYGNNLLKIFLSRPTRSRLP